MNTDACDLPRAIMAMGRRGCVVPGQTWVSCQRAFAGLSTTRTWCNVCYGYAFHVVRRLYREYLFIGSTSSTRTAGTRSCRWLPRASLPCPALPFRPMRVQACACVRVYACVSLCSRYSAWTAVSFGISALPAVRTALLRPLAATRCADRRTAWAFPPRGLNGLTPGTEWAHPVPDLNHEQGSARARSSAGTGLALRARPLRTCTGTKRAHPSSVSTWTGAHPHVH
jgi:hypothetical protein